MTSEHSGIAENLRAVVDLFAGPGGWDIGARSLGIDPIGIEWDDAACLTREAAGLRTRQGDLTTMDPLEFDGIDGLIASPPCTDWSVAGKQARWSGSSGWLVEIPMRWVRALSPTWVAFEQVPTVLPLWELYAEQLRADGYHAWTGCLQAEQFGVPQTRRRAVLLASREPFAPPVPTHSKFYPRDPGRLDPNVLPWISMASALGWGFTKRPSTTVVARTHVDGRSTGGVRALDGGSGARETYRRAIASGDWVHYRPSPTIVGSFRPDIVAAPGWRKAGDGPRQNTPGSVQITVQEAGILQSFAADHPWQGNRAKQFQQVGNAIPPRVAAVSLSSVTGLALREDEAA